MASNNGWWQHTEAVPDDLVELGAIVGAYGVRGWFKIRPYASSETLLAVTQWWLKSPKRPDSVAALHLLSMKKHSNCIVACVKDILTPEAAEELKGCGVWVSRRAFPVPAEGEYYWVDLLGLSAINLQQQVLGQVVDLVDNGAHAILRLAYLDTDQQGVESKRERLVPFVKAYIHEIDWVKRTVYIDWQLDY